MSILNYFLDLKQDFLLSNLRTVFIELCNEHGLFDMLEEGVKNEELHFGRLKLADDKSEDSDGNESAHSGGSEAEAGYEQKIRGILKREFKGFIKRMLPEVYPTGTSLDKTDPILIEQELDTEGSPFIPLLDIFGVEILPSLIQLFCLNNNPQIQNAVFDVIIRLYN